MKDCIKTNWKRIVIIVLIIAVVLLHINFWIKTVLRWGYGASTEDVLYFRLNKKEYDMVSNYLIDVYDREKLKNPQLEYISLMNGYSTEWIIVCHGAPMGENEELYYEIKFEVTSNTLESCINILERLNFDYHGDISFQISVTEDYVRFYSPRNYSIIKSRSLKIPNGGYENGEIKYREIITFGWYLIAV